jgi:hypothetical protein
MAASDGGCRIERAAKSWGLRILGGADALGRLDQIIGRVSNLHTRSEQEPVSARLAKRHPDAARVDDSGRADHAIELHVCVTADHQRGVQPVKKWQQTVFRRQARKGFGLASGVPWQKSTVPNAPISIRSVLGQPRSTASYSG